MTENKIPFVFTGVIRDKFQWVGDITPNTIRIGVTPTSRECSHFSSVVAKFNKVRGVEKGIVVLGHYNTEKGVVAIFSMGKEEYEDKKGSPTLLREWQRSIPEAFK